MKSEPSSNAMTKRDLTWDYRQPAIYLITLTLAERRPLLGKLIIPDRDGIQLPERAYIVYSDWGHQVVQCLRSLPEKHPELQIIQYQLMPDHLHFAVRVTRPMQVPLGSLINLFKHLSSTLPSSPASLPSFSHSLRGRCRLADRGGVPLPASRCSSPIGAGPAPSSPSPALWAPGFNDNRLRTRGQLQHMIAYIQDNPRRLALKRLHRDLLRVQRGCSIAGRAYDAVGNTGLLAREKRAVHVRSRWTAEEKRAYKNDSILAARQGAVLVGPFISPDERAVLKVALEEGLAVIYLQENGFPELYKPAGELIDSCVEGRVLLLAPWPYHTRRQAITREQCLQLNRMAEELSQSSQS